MMTITSDHLGTTGVVTLAGRFTFECHGEFRSATDPFLADPAITEIRVRMAGLDYMDASSLGMLLVLREKAELKGKNVVLVDPAPCARTVLESVQFGKLFKMGG
jgi:anti-anti-sigma factor